MTQLIKKLKPLTVNTGTAKQELTESESPFMRGYEIAISKNGKGEEGGNFGMGKKMSSNFQTISIDLPAAGFNKTIGFYEAQELNEAYVLNYNSEGFHGVYLLDGVNLISQKICVSPSFDFSLDPKHGIPPHRCYLRIVWGIDENGERIVIEKYFIFTNGYGWQKWLNVVSGIATNGYDQTVNSYYTLQPPHYDASELIDYVSRPPMFAPVITPVTPTLADAGQQNLLFQKSTQFAYRFILTDGRATTLSWFSTPYFKQPSTCDANNLSDPRCLNLQLYAGSPLVEKIQIVVRNNGESNTDGIAVDTDWALYDTIYKYSTDDQNDPSVINNQYWKRTDPWAAYNYNSTTNTITYNYCGDKGTTVFDVNDALMVQNDIPLKSAALTPAGDVIIWSDNLRFYPNITDSVLNNISLDVIDIGSTSGACELKTVKISLYATFDSGCFSVQNGASDLNRYFGRMRVDINTNKLTLDLSGDSIPYGLNFGTSDGFLCYLAGTSYYAIGKQYQVDSHGNKTELDVVDMTNLEAMAGMLALYKSGGYVVQQFDFEVPEGKYIARLARHGALVTSDYELSSTYVLGIAQNNNLSGWLAPYTSAKEILVDASAGDVDLWTTTKELFYVFCPFYPGEKGSNVWFLKPYTHNQSDSGDSWRIIEGYVIDNIDDDGVKDLTSTTGIERVVYYAQLGANSNKIGGAFTDHNGFFFVFTDGDDRARSSEVFFDAQFGCVPYHTGAFRTQINISKRSGYFPGQILNISDIDVSLGNFISVKGSVINCESDIGISNVGVTITQGKTYYTDSQGNYEIRVHTLNSHNRIETLYLNGNGNCLFNNCDCSIIQPIVFNSTGIPCSNNSIRIAPTMPTFNLKVVSISGSSMKGGGRYPVGAVLHDFGGRKTPIGVIGYVDVPTFLEKGNFNPSQIRVTINSALLLPKWAKWLTFSIGKNVNADKYLQWVGDKIEFIDGLGNITADGNGAIRARITIQSLLDFNISQNFSTTATYQFVKGDMLRIYDDGQGNLFDPATNNGFLDYQVLGSDFNDTIDQTQTVTTSVVGGVTTTATAENTYDPKSFIIEYDERLLALKGLCGFWIELSRKSGETDDEPFFGISGTYPILKGQIAPSQILLDAFDTFYQKRNIIISGCSGADLNHPFESQSVTDYWGDNVTQDGQVLFKDPLAEQRWYLNDSIKSDAFTNEGRVNGLGTCRTENRKNFNDQNWGGIVATFAQRNIILFICENDWFTTDYQNNYAHVDQYGRVIANPDSAAGIGSPYQKVGDNFGCAMEDINTIVLFDGLVFWQDRQNFAFVMNNFRDAVDISAIDNKSYFIEKIKFMQRFNTAIGNNLNNIIETSAGFNPNNGCIYISWRPRNNMGQSPVGFINNEREVFYSLGETFIYSPAEKKWVGWAPFVPEYYGSMGQSQSGAELITFSNGKSWFHNSKGVKGSMNFYGVDTDQVINIVSNFDQSKLKIYQSIGIESKIKYFISKISTDDPTLYSLLSLGHFVKRGNVLYAELLRNMNSYPDPSNPVVSLLQDGKSINGNYCEFQLVSDPKFSRQYNELNNILIRFIGSEKSEK